jgi:hypothetical protein
MELPPAHNYYIGLRVTIVPKGLLLWMSAFIYSKISIKNISSIDSQTKEKISLAPTPFSDETSLFHNTGFLLPYGKWCTRWMCTTCLLITVLQAATRCDDWNSVALTLRWLSIALCQYTVRQRSIDLYRMDSLYRLLPLLAWREGNIVHCKKSGLKINLRSEI